MGRHMIEAAARPLGDSPTIRMAFLGDDIDVAKRFAHAAARAQFGREQLLHARGVRNVPLAEVFVYAGLECAPIAEAVALACESVWALRAFPGLAHVSSERHNALYAADIVLDGTRAARGSASGALADSSYERTLRMDMALLAPTATLVAAGSPDDDWEGTFARAVVALCR